MLKVAINGFGRIGRLALRIGLEKYADKIKFVAINTSGRVDTAGWAHLFEHDTVYGKYDGEVKVDVNNLVVDGVKVPVMAVAEPRDLPWEKLEVDLVLECTGKFRKRDQVKDHLEAGAKRVLLSAPLKEADDGIFLIGINEKKLKDNKIFSNASCTTNCVGPVAKVILDNFGIKKAGMTTIHAVTSSQRMVDNSHKDLRRARAGCFNMIPTTTGAAKSTVSVLPELKGKFDGIAVRVPILTGSLVDFTFMIEKKTTVKEVNQALEKASKGELKGVLGITDKPLVSSDIIGCEYSSLVNSDMTRVIDGDMVKILSWYDNEWGYVARMMELALL
ncbi:MAG: type I glyceraldehyde-3-phosphate dehydrogenase [Patescibacteria group bacterium]|nr:type I glyceraldehyde-3-phosphate dehydrogenase [Patescibacteria group bacterium]